MVEESAEDVNQKAVDIVENEGVAVSKEDISVCNRLPTQKLGSKTMIATFVKHHTKHILLTNR